MFLPAANVVSRTPHRLAIVLAALTFPLIWVGGLVTTYNAGMAVPDWPNTYGYNLFLYPWQTWLFGPWDLFIEHGHRLLGAVVGLATIAVLLGLWVFEPRQWVRWYGVLLLLAVVGQGVLGGLRVLLDQRLLAKIHGCTGPLFFALAAALVVFTSDRWRTTKRSSVDPARGRLHIFATVTTGLAYAQVFLGAQLRHVSTATDAREFQTFVMFHLLVAALLAIQVGMLVAYVGRYFRQEKWLTWPSRFLGLLLTCQLALGFSAWVVNYGWPAVLRRYDPAPGFVVVQEGLMQALTTTAHVAVGSLILVTSVVLSLRVWRLVQPGMRGEAFGSALMGVTA